MIVVRPVAGSSVWMGVSPKYSSGDCHSGAAKNLWRSPTRWLAALRKTRAHIVFGQW